MDRRIRRSKDALKNALIKTISKKTIKQVQIKELCELADVNRSTFYANYDGIEELLLDVFIDVYKEIMTVYRKQSMEDIVSYYERNKKRIALLIASNSDNLFEKGLVEYFWNNYNEGKKINLNEKYKFIYSVSGSFSVIHQWLIDGCKLSIKDLSDLIIAMTK